MHNPLIKVADDIKLEGILNTLGEVLKFNISLINWKTGHVKLNSIKTCTFILLCIAIIYLFILHYSNTEKGQCA